MSFDVLNSLDNSKHCKFTKEILVKLLNYMTYKVG